jgi:glycine cleavage system H lipoate-binding protein/ABC-type phosphate transport system substrate-binding protein
MKTTIFLIVGFLLFIATGSANSQDLTSKNKDLQEGSVSIMCSPDLHELTSKLASEYSSLNPEVKINIINASFESTELVAGENLGFISNISSSAFNDAEHWKLAVGRNIIVPVINSGNPYLKELQKQGITQQQFVKLFKNPETTNWGNLLTNSSQEKIRVYVVNDETVKSGLEKFLKDNQLHYSGIALGSREEMILAISRDPNAIGFCKVADVQNADNQELLDNISMLPIDKNGNGTIDYMEDIYTDMNTFHRGVWIGKYPKVLVSNIYAVSNAQPVNESQLAFLKWVLTDGQKYMSISGYSELASSESQSQLDKMNLAAINLAEEQNGNSLSKILVGILTVIVIGMVISAVVRSNRKRKHIVSIPATSDEAGFDAGSVAVPNGLYFDKTHTWAFMEKDGLVSIGIDDFLQHITGPITRIEMKSAGERIKKGELLFSIIQSGKQLNMYAPVSGVIKSQNESLLGNSSFLNHSPYSDGWVYRIEPSNWFKEMQMLDRAEKYRTWLNAEFSRLKDFMAAILKPESPEYAHVVLQDGGEMKEGVLSGFGPEVWEDFQANFIDTFK